MRIAIINDSAVAVEALRRVVRSNPVLELAWTAADGLEGVARATADRPDLILMDLIMPRLDGVEATRRIMRECPCPILVVTATVSGHIDKVYEAMGHGALDAVNTPTIGLDGANIGGESLLRKINQVGALLHKPAGRSWRSPGASTAAAGAVAHPVRSGADRAIPLVVVGASTGGPRALAQVLSALPPRWPAAIVVAQHIGADFAPGLVRWLGEHSRLPVRLGRPGDVPELGTVLVSGTNDHLVLSPDGLLDDVTEPRAAPYRPSVDVFFASVAAHWSRPGAAVILTGMGRDGAGGLLALRRLGWLTIAQDRDTSAVWGMPRFAVELGAAVEVQPPDRIAARLVRWRAETRVR